MLALSLTGGQPSLRLPTPLLLREARAGELHALLTEPDTLRRGDRVRQLKAELADQQQAIEKLYAHWEEATELNG